VDQYKEVFKQEAYELLPQLEENLLAIEKDPLNSEPIQQVYRALHTLKGSGSMFGFNNIASFIHVFEDLFDKIRKGEITPDKKMIDLTLASCDYIKMLLDMTNGEGWVNENTRETLLLGIKEFLGDEISDDQLKKQDDISPAVHLEVVTYRIRFIPHADLFLSGTKPMLLFKELQELGECRINAILDKIPPLDSINPESCYTYWDIVLTTTVKIDAIKDIFIFVEDKCTLTIDEISSNSDLRQHRLGEILVERGDISSEELEKVIDKKKLIGEILLEEGLVNRDKLNTALEEQKEVKKVQERLTQKTQQASVRIPSEKLDQLVNLVGELVTTQARLNQLSNRLDDSELQSIAEETERMIWELRDSTMNIRMLPMGAAFNRLRRLVRDLSSEMNKEVDLIIEGEETELDKSIIEKLNDPLVHLIRNSLDHGLENPDEREQVGKKRHGIIHLSAFHSGASVIIRIRDDGRGMDKDVIFAKAVEKGLVNADEKLEDREIYKLIFQPGFSTAQNVTNVSGRGVGMDVVQKNISSLRGNIDVETELDQFTEISLKLPLTLAIIDGMLIEIGGSFFVFPLYQIDSVVDFSEKELAKAEGRNMIRIRGEVVPYIKLRDLLGIKDNNETYEKIVLVNIEDKKVGFLVDNIIGKHQTVIKSLGKVYQDVKGVSGATILGNGDIALILDPDLLVKAAKIEEDKIIARG